jgi:hypothetical protein
MKKEGRIQRNKQDEEKIPPGTLMSVCCECCVGSGLWEELITRLEESYGLCVM